MATLRRAAVTICCTVAFHPNPVSLSCNSPHISSWGRSLFLHVFLEELSTTLPHQECRPGQPDFLFQNFRHKRKTKNGRICGGNLSISLVPTTHAPSSIPGSLNFLSPDHFLFFWYPELSDILSIKSYFIPLHENLVSVPYNQKPYKRLGGCKKMWTKRKLRQEKQVSPFWRIQDKLTSTTQERALLSASEVQNHICWPGHYAQVDIPWALRQEDPSPPAQEGLLRSSRQFYCTKPRLYKAEAGGANSNTHERQDGNLKGSSRGYQKRASLCLKGQALFSNSQLRS